MNKAIERVVDGSGNAKWRTRHFIRLEGVVPQARVERMKGLMRTGTCTVRGRSVIVIGIPSDVERNGEVVIEITEKGRNADFAKVVGGNLAERAARIKRAELENFRRLFFEGGREG